MSAWAYRCHSPRKGESDWFVSQLDVEGLPADIAIVRVKVGSEWKCAVLDRSQRVAVETQLLRAVVASSEADCPSCAALLAANESNSAPDTPASCPTSNGSTSATSHSPDSKSSSTVQAAAISLHGKPFVVIVVPMALITSPGEADMAIEDLQPYFGAAPVILLAQKEDGSPSYYGEPTLVDLAASIPIDKMPWQKYPVG